jgi:hypothetical protein
MTLPVVIVFLLTEEHIGAMDKQQPGHLLGYEIYSKGL